MLNLSNTKRLYAAGLCAALALPLCLPVTAVAAQVTGRFAQAEQRDAYGRITVEASVISVLNCNGAGENGRQFYIYRYVNRGGFRAILPPYWGSPIGGRDWSTFQIAARVACTAGTGRQPAPPAQPVAPSYNGITGTWQLTSNCGFNGDVASHGYWNATIALTEGSDGSLTGSVQDQNNDTIFPNPSGYNSDAIQSRVNGNTMTLVLHPQGWASVLELTGTISGNQIAGSLHHYTSDDCAFNMTRR